MSKVTTQNLSTPREVSAEFLYALQQTVTSYDQITPVLRGSTLMQHWFGNAARPAADIDLEWFPQLRRDGTLLSSIEQARKLCMRAVSDHDASPIVFDGEIPVPNDGVNLNLWEYDTPGFRCYTGWRWDDRGLRGCLQVDIALAGSYDLTGVAPEIIEFPREWGEQTRVLAYTPEMLLAAKLSWIIRHVQRIATTTEGDILVFRGEPKDLFDAYLLLTKGNLRAEVFRNALFAVAMEDNLDWNRVSVFLDQGPALPQEDWLSLWPDFFNTHQHLIHHRPYEMLRTVIERLRTLIGDIGQHLPFLRSIQGGPNDEVNILIYADWLEDRGDLRAEFLRHYCRFFFHKDYSARTLAARLLSDQPGGWLYHVLGSPSRSRDIRQRIEPNNDAAGN